MSETNTKKTVKMPHIFAILFCVLVLVTILTHLMPAGEYTRFVDEATGRTVIDPLSYTQVPGTPVGLLAMLTAIPEGFEQAALIVILTFCVAGT